MRSSKGSEVTYSLHANVMRRSCKILVGKLEEQNHLGEFWCMWEDNTRINNKEAMF
jgi:hypothetical protein